jgi:beta-galactosidase
MGSDSFRLYHGAAWYPEQWDDATLRDDVVRMRDLGLNVVRLGEFAWSRMEPKDGEFEFDWLLRALDLAGGHGLSALLGTPTAAPPQWMMLAHPEIGYVEPDGYRHSHGARQHACYNNPIFRQYANRIAASMAQVVGGHKAVIGWQVDNELRGHQKLCLCEACQAAWGQWLSNRYESLEELNAKWGTEVWSNRYERFEDIPRPTPVPTWSHHYSVLLNYRRFMSDSAVDFLNGQCEEIRKYSGAPITHNTEDSVDEWTLFQDLDFAAADIYVNHLGLVGAQWRIDSMRNVKPGKRFWTADTGVDVEIQGQIADSGWLACFAFQNYTGGSQAFLYWPWRQLRTGTEIGHLSVIYANGRETPGYKGAKKVSSLRTSLEPILSDFHPSPADVVLIRSEPNGHYYFSDRVAGLEPNFDYQKRISSHYRSLVEAGAWRDVLCDEAPIENRKIIFSPYLPHVSAGFLEKMQQHLKRGGAWVIGPYCGYREADHTVPLNGLYGAVEEFIGFETRYLSPGGPVNISLFDRTDTVAEMMVSVFVPSEQDEILGTYTDGRFAGEAWGIARGVCGGRVYVLGSELADPGRQHLFETLLDRENIPRYPMPSGVWMSPQETDGGRKAWAISNTNPSSQVIDLPRPGQDLLTGGEHAEQINLEPFQNAFVAFDEAVLVT